MALVHYTALALVVEKVLVLPLSVYHLLLLTNNPSINLHQHLTAPATNLRCGTTGSTGSAVYSQVVSGEGGVLPYCSRNKLVQPK